MTTKEEIKKEDGLNLGSTSTGSGTKPGSEDGGTKSPKESKKETVEMSREDFNKLMEKLDRQAKDIEILYKASDKSKMAKALASDGENLIKKVNLWNWDGSGKIVIATELKTNRCEVVLGKWYEDQSVAVVLDDGESFTVPYIEFSRKIISKIPAEIISTKKEVDKNKKESIFYQVQLENGKKLEINAAFVN